LICDEQAHGCARSRRHPHPEIVRRIEELIDDCFTRP
jgi:holo-ACP synthase